MKKTKTNNEEFAMMGIAALLPGMRFMVKLMTDAISEKETLLALLQDGTAAFSDDLRRKASSGPWAKMTPEERSVEMKRRQAVSKAKKARAASPLDKNHPDHAKWAAKRRKQYAAKSPAQKKKWLEAMAAGKRKKKRQTVREAKNQPVVTMEKTA